MDREALDFHRSAAMAASTGEQIAAPENRPIGNRPVEMRERLYARDRNAGQSAGQHPRDQSPRDQYSRDAASQQSRSIQTVTIQSILKGAREAIIDFDGAAYRLRITRNHRLILTK